MIRIKIGSLRRLISEALTDHGPGYRSDGSLEPSYWNNHEFKLTQASVDYITKRNLDEFPPRPGGPKRFTGEYDEPPSPGDEVNVYKVREGDDALQISYTSKVDGKKISVSMLPGRGFEKTLKRVATADRKHPGRRFADDGTAQIDREQEPDGKTGTVHIKPHVV